MFGLLNINKPAGMTSRDVVNHIQRLIRPVKVGHAGTLDPLATGVLVLCLGKATRLIRHVQNLPKRYEAAFVLGRRSDTEDIEGEVQVVEGAPVPDLPSIQDLLPEFTGTIQQRPPAFSAIKIQGKRAYQLARAGKSVQLPPRPVIVHDLQVLELDYPRLVLAIDCASGTYVRSLGRDLAERLGTAAVMARLERTEIGPFHVKEASKLDELTRDDLGQYLLPVELALSQLPTLTLTDREALDVSFGRAVLRPAHGIAGEVAALDERGGLVALLVPRDPDQLRPSQTFRSPNVTRREGTS